MLGGNASMNDIEVTPTLTNLTNLANLTAIANLTKLANLVTTYATIRAAPAAAVPSTKPPSLHIRTNILTKKRPVFHPNPCAASVYHHA